MIPKEIYAWEREKVAGNGHSRVSVQQKKKKTILSALRLPLTLLCSLWLEERSSEWSITAPPFNFCLVEKLVARHKTPRPSRTVLRAWGRGGVVVLAFERPAMRGPKW